MSPSSITLSCRSSPATSPRAHSPEVIRTNTLAVTSIPKAFFEPVILELLSAHFSSFGPINQWVPLAGFSRIIIVYENEDDAENAKVCSDPIVLNIANGRMSKIVLRVYRADPNPLIARNNEDTIPQDNYLKPPPLEKNFLISPPGSPPVGWEAVREDPPNATPLADDLIEALKKLQVHQKRKPSLELVLEPSEESGVGVYVEDFDLAQGNDPEEEVKEEDWVYGVTAPARSKWIPVPTAMPPMRSVSV
ncbi:hypothetical protein AGABI2DRAFT_134344 [Agaricus bisporus var. bisporus H97]|uniref:hypothetical protein n=1 Tax=Agaricus bisporus var. bisporus (strain H97 / ATCC MYA-4626 / FGSC 10389) TaxID=936046 RepID=UPI00029F6541|nr:hypothetical protein AGABI2DRAFT_134344 [Agaricus bisporus var. bisporus H97]EKV50598.1 hypothetical protein AGABI2DRAFT_134344 [Agaricus bisporus var. bisporus H97]